MHKKKVKNRWSKQTSKIFGCIIFVELKQVLLNNHFSNVTGFQMFVWKMQTQGVD